MNGIFGIISMNDFSNLYRFKEITISRALIFKSLNKDDVYKKLELIHFEYDDSYIIIELIQNICSDTSNNLKIENIKQIFTLSENAKQSYQFKFNSNIKFKVLENFDILSTINQKQFNDMEQGAELILEQFELNLEEIKSINIEKIKQLLISDKKYFDLLDEKNGDFYYHILLYQRMNKFNKKQDVSYIYDVLIILTLITKESTSENFKKEGLRNINKSETYKSLAQHKDKNLYELIEIVLNPENERFKKFLNQLLEANLPNKLVISVIFLKLKYEILNNFSFQKEIEQIYSQFKKKYEVELAIALYLIGLVFGFKILNDGYYNYKKISIFQETPPVDSNNKDEACNSNLINLDEINKDGLVDILYGLNKQKDKKTDLKKKSPDILIKEIKAKINRKKLHRQTTINYDT